MGSEPQKELIKGLEEYRYGFSDPETYVFKSRRGLDRAVVEQLSAMKGEPAWMLEFRLKAFEHFQKRPMPAWGADLSGLDLDNIFYYVKPTEGKGASSWEDVPDAIKQTFDRLGIPEAERKFLAGVGAQYESEMVYHSIQAQLEKQGVIFLSIENGLRQYPDLFRKYFSTVIPIEDNKFAALNSAVWSGGSFVYVPPYVKVELPLQAYFRLNVANIIHFAPHTSSKITSKSISRGGGRSSFRGLLKVYKGAIDSRSNTVCDALLLDPQSRSDTYPSIEIDEEDVTIGHEASVSKVGEEQLFYLMSRGLSQEQATTMVVSGFIEPLVKELPMEYAVEMNRLIQLQMSGSVG
jgi:Fe-S cluster assembly scaffold protein SufB